MSNVRSDLESFQRWSRGGAYTVCPLLVIFHHFGDFGLSDGDQMVRENNGDFGVIFVFLGN